MADHISAIDLFNANILLRNYLNNISCVQSRFPQILRNTNFKENLLSVDATEYKLVWKTTRRKLGFIKNIRFLINPVLETCLSKRLFFAMVIVIRKTKKKTNKKKTKTKQKKNNIKNLM